ncbi:hypothetical protein KIF53_00310 [Chromobacterium subtsugae]|mgnify:CR=1 FL=1|uniref:Lipoprotein n=1 Tax=Chromobacterium subtsugae TaxID=251747 RepID=A0ABS7F9G0_9NEIS|nr:MULTISPECIES: hypothetical protein [Chromobacterium]KUM02202.1 hypothetical protein Cv017_04290 [Chromobacterium subtsugae]KZE83145.1 hypothetical protein AWB61_05890 [Chromobacterium sp. F49]MBW7567105.1 hypothetical protein [Chromobacterium subtsugae]MBW8286075.1 hypothetical protein [Chromobacterium subtsugae]WSE91869.1 hypothetical protein U6115_01120 [Chromobacterium subtsugae]
MKKILALSACALALSGCSAMTTMSSSAPKGAVSIYQRQQVTTLDLPKTETYPTTSFGNYEFKATGEGKQPLYGLLPLKFNGGYVAADILFFAPALFFNLREVYPLYDFDLDKGVVRYRLKDTDNWTEYKPTQPEAERARSHIDFAASQPAAEAAPVKTGSN